MKRLLLAILGLVAVVVILGGKAIANEPAAPSKGNDMRAKLQAAMSTFEASPCTSVLQLEHSNRFGGSRKWWLTCDGCAGVPGNKIFPKNLLRIADDMSIDNKVYLRDMFKAIGQCH